MVMDSFVEVERELNWTHSVSINAQYFFFCFSSMSTIVKQDVLTLSAGRRGRMNDESTKRNCP